MLIRFWGSCHPTPAAIERLSGFHCSLGEWERPGKVHLLARRVKRHINKRWSFAKFFWFWQVGLQSWLVCFHIGEKSSIMRKKYVYGKRAQKRQTSLWAMMVEHVQFAMYCQPWLLVMIDMLRQGNQHDYMLVAGYLYHTCCKVCISVTKLCLP